MTSSATQQKIDNKVTKYWEKMGRLNLLMGTITAQDQKKGLEQSRKNQEAEASAVRKNVWGWEDSEASEDEMGDQIVLGDIRTDNHLPPPPAPKPSSNVAKVLAAGGLAALGLGAGAVGVGAAAALPIAAYQMLKQEPASVIVNTPEMVDTDTDTNTRYRLKVYREDE